MNAVFVFSCNSRPIKIQRVLEFKQDTWEEHALNKMITSALFRKNTACLLWTGWLKIYLSAEEKKKNPVTSGLILLIWSGLDSFIIYYPSAGNDHGETTSPWSSSCHPLLKAIFHMLFLQYKTNDYWHRASSLKQ